MKPFFITGFPRSRTAWMAAACMSIPSVMCLHEPLEYSSAWQQSLSAWREPVLGYEFYGISDSGLGFHLREILEEFSPQVLIVCRPESEVIQSLKAGEFSSKFLEVLSDRMSEVGADSRVLRVDFDEIDARLPDIFGHLLPGVAVDWNKMWQLRRLNVQAQLERVRAVAARRSGDLSGIIGNDVVVQLAAP